MAELKSIKAYHTYSEFSGYLLPVDMVIGEIARLPLDGVLGFIASLSLDMLQLGEKFDSPQFQGEYLNYALVDDFPRKIPGIEEMIIPGRVPITGGRHTFLHEQNLAWLCHAALLHSRRDSFTLEITHYLKYRLSRLLLIVNDFLMVDNLNGLGTLVQRRSFAQDLVRRYQYNFWRHSIETVYKLSRQRVLFHDLLPKYFPDLDSHFIKAMGISLQRYFEIVILFVSHIYAIMAPGKQQWLSKATLSSKVKANRHEIDCLLARWTQTPLQYDDSFRKWKSEQADTRLSALSEIMRQAWPPQSKNAFGESSHRIAP